MSALHIEPSEESSASTMSFAERSAKQLVRVVQLAASTIDEKGNVAPSTDLVHALRDLDERQKQVMVTGLAMMRSVRNRLRTLPTANTVGQELAPVLECMNGLPEEALTLLAVALDRPDLNDPLPPPAGSVSEPEPLPPPPPPAAA